MNKAFFLDRDGTINVDYNYVYKPDEWTWRTAAVEAIQWMNKNDFKVIVVTNQSGIVRGHYDEEHVDHLHNWVDEELERHDAWIDGWYIAPHHPDHDVQSNRYDPEDRKPGTGMFEKAKKRFNIDFKASYMAGDKTTDIKPALTLGITPFFIRSRRESSQNLSWIKNKNVKICNNLGEAVQHIDPAFSYPSG